MRTAVFEGTVFLNVGNQLIGARQKSLKQRRCQLGCRPLARFNPKLVEEGRPNMTFAIAASDLFFERLKYRVRAQRFYLALIDGDQSFAQTLSAFENLTALDFQLLDQRRRNQVGRRRHDHLVERGVLGPTVIPIGNLELDIGAALSAEPLLRLSPKLFNDPAIWKFQCIVVGGHLVFVDLPKDRCFVVDYFIAPSNEARR
jgi:hypothetical protein